MRTSQAAAFLHCAYALGPDATAKADILWRLTKNLRAGLGLARHRPDKVYQLRTTFGPLWLRDNFGDITNLPGLLDRGVYRWKGLSGPGIIVDAGANIGLAARWFAHFNPDRPIVCCEPIAENTAILRRNCPRPLVIEAAMGDATGTVELLTDPDNVIASSIPTAWGSAARTFPMRTLDDCAEEFGWSDVALLKMDAEGMEPAILRGGERLLVRTARVVAETHGEIGHAEVLSILNRAGFRILDASYAGTTGMVFAER
jgi:FkbM family methyltransferase